MDKKLKIDLADSISGFRYFLKRFEIKTKKYKTFFRGKSYEFEGFRSFTPDDDISSVDWKASAKAGQLTVRQYKEEEDKKIIFVLDIGDTMVAGSSDKLKCEYSAEIVLSLVDLMVNFNDRVGLILYNDKMHAYFPPKRGRKIFDIYLDALSDGSIYRGGSNLKLPIEFIMQNFDNSVSAVILVSDFINLNKKMKHSLELLGSKYETIAFIVRDPIDKALPKVFGEFVISDPKTGSQILIDPKIASNVYERNALEQINFIKEVFKDSNIDFLELNTQNPFVHEVINFLVERVKG